MQAHFEASRPTASPVHFIFVEVDQFSKVLKHLHFEVECNHKRTLQVVDVHFCHYPQQTSG